MMINIIKWKTLEVYDIGSNPLSPFETTSVLLATLNFINGPLGLFNHKNIVHRKWPLFTGERGGGGVPGGFRKVPHIQNVEVEALKFKCIHEGRCNQAATCDVMMDKSKYFYRFVKCYLDRQNDELNLYIGPLG